MYFILLLLFFCLFIFLFVSFILTKDDFVILRKNINQENIFDLCFSTTLIGLFFARLFFVFFNFKTLYLNPLVFFAFPYFPGFLVSGGVLGALIFIFIKSIFSKLPFERILDFFMLAFLPSWSLGLFLNFIYAKKTILLLPVIIPLIIFGIFILFLSIFQKNRFKDGSIGFLSLILFSSISLIIQFLFKKDYILFVSKNEYCILIPILLFSVVMFLKQEKLLPLFKK